MRTYYGTKVVGVAGNSTLVYVDKTWGLKANDIVDISIYDIDKPEEKISATKKVCRIGPSNGIFLDKGWGFKKGTLVVFRVTPRGAKLADTRIGTEETDEALSD